MPKPHHKPRNVTLTKIARLRTGFKMKDSWFVGDTAADRAIKGQHLGFEVSVQALLRMQGVS